jgi:hypothetical protein
MNAILRSRILITLLLSLAGWAGVTSGRSQSSNSPARPIPVIHFKGVPLSAALDNLARQAELNYSLAPELKVNPKIVDARWEKMTAEHALQELLNEHGLFLVQSPVSTVSRVSRTNQITTVVDGNWVRADTNTAVPVIQFVSTPLDRALVHLAETAKLELEMDPRLSRPVFEPGKPITLPATVSVRWHNLTPRQAIAALCENYDLSLRVTAANSKVVISQAGDSKNSLDAKSKPGQRQP